jgi:hypothetical protein
MFGCVWQRRGLRTHMTRVAYYRVTRPGGRLGLSPLVLVSRALCARSTTFVNWLSKEGIPISEAEYMYNLIIS